MNKIVITTGYMGSGSSAATDLISEFRGYDFNNGDFEYVLLHCPDGLFDLEDKLLLGNTAIRSDEAMHRFLECAKNLYDTKNYWPGMYKKRISTSFLDITAKFIDSICDFKFDEGVYWYYQQLPDRIYLQLKNYGNRMVSKLFKKNTKPVLKYNQMFASYPESDDFYKASRVYLSELYSLLGYDKHNLLMDQFLLPHNLYRLDRYFDSNVRVIVVDRDPRDVFILNKYVWLLNNCPVAFPLDVEDFCMCYKKMRNAEKMIEDSRILRLHFEDMIYRYEDTLTRIYDFLNVDKEDHIHFKEKLKPDVSINNTQVYLNNTSYAKEIEIIENQLSEYLYAFPYKRSNISRECF